MINIVTGTIGAGKTSYLERHYEKHRQGDGLVSPKYFEGETHKGYDILHVKSGKRVPFIRLKESIPQGWKAISEIGKYSFSATGFEFAGEILDRISGEPVYLDEIGPLEILHNLGFNGYLKELIESGKELFLGVRYSLLDDMIKKYINNKEINVITI